MTFVSQRGALASECAQSSITNRPVTTCMMLVGCR